MNPFRQLLAHAADRWPVGTWIMSASPLVAEGVGHAGYDWGVVDMEHTPLDLMEIIHLLQALAGTPLVPVVRVPWNDTVTMKRVLDAGAPNVMVPNIRSAAEAREAVAWTRFPPEGLRGVASSTRAGNYTRYKDFLGRANDEIGLVLQIESREALDDLDAICRVPGVDAVFIGPSDLSAALGHRGQPGHPDVQAAISKAFKTAHAAGRAAGILCADGKADPYLAQGATMVGVGTDLHLLIAGADALAARFRPGT